MRFGHCKNCWWWEKIPSTIDVVDGHSTGMCWMQGTSYSPRHTGADSYCPDYANRRKTNKEFGQTLEEWKLECKSKNKFFNLIE